MSVEAGSIGRSAVGLETRSITKSFRSKRALDNINISVPNGSLTVILGAAGAGKTTLLRLIAGLEQPDAGHIAIGGKSADHLEPRDRDVAMIFDNLALYPNKTGYENIANPLRIARRDEATIEAQVMAIAGKLRIGHVLRRLPKTMSGGERQRVALGRAFVRQPKLFLLDEPLSSLDAMLRIELRAELRRLQKEFGHTFVLATPDFAEAMAIADVIVFLREGQIVQTASPQEMYEKPQDWEVARFLGAPEINLLPATFTPTEGGRVILEGASFEAPAALQRGGDRDGFAFTAGLRPENLQLTSGEDGLWRGIITDIEPLGLKAVVTVTVNGHELRVLTAAATIQKCRLGDHAGLSFLPSKLIAFDNATKLRIT